MSITSFTRRIAIACAVVVAAAGLTLAQSSSASAAEQLSGDNYGDYDALGGLTIAQDDGSGTRRIVAGPLRVRMSPAAPGPQRIEVTARLQRWDGYRWTTAGEPKRSVAWATDPKKYTQMPIAMWNIDGPSSLYRVVNTIHWLVEDFNFWNIDLAFGRLVIAPSQTYENTCATRFACTAMPEGVFV